MAKSESVSEPDYARAIREHFQALDFDQQTDVLERLKVVYDANSVAELEDLQKRMAKIQALTGKRLASAPHSERSANTRPRGNVAIAYYDPATGNHSTGRGSWKKAPWVQEYISKGGDIEKLKVSADNPLPPELTS